jgi:hypothetical protein
VSETHLDLARTGLEPGSPSAQHMVVLFRAIEEAELQRDVPALEEALVLAQSISSPGDAALREEGDRLVDFLR